MVSYFLEEGFDIIALDRFYFGPTLDSIKSNPHLTILKADIRFVKDSVFKGVDTVINLASISNDPASELNPAITRKINDLGAYNLARKAKANKVRLYIFASSCSVYGAGKGIVNEVSLPNPLSEYARSKVNAEKKILRIADSRFNVVVLRMATLFGLSTNRMRFDLIINLMTLHAFKNRKIYIMGGGKQWRPLLHVSDAIRAFSAVIEYSRSSAINKQVFNVGSDSLNYQVYQVANALKARFPDLIIEEAPDDPDQRSYHVTFKKITQLLHFKATKTIEDGILEIKEALEKGEVIDDIKTNTMWYYRYLIEADKILGSIKKRNKLF
jgi:nucleoside-diphosphate-sugar epimerase